MSADGSTVVVGDSVSFPDTVRVMRQSEDGSWMEEAELTNPTGLGAFSFGRHVSVSPDGQTVAVGAANDPSGSSGVDGDMFDQSVTGAGAVFVYERLENATWVLQGYLKHSAPAQNDHFAASTFFNGGDGLFVGSTSSDGPSIHEFTRGADGSWSAQSVIDVFGYETSDQFDTYVSASADGTVVAVGSQNNNVEEVFSGAVHVYSRAAVGAPWTESGFLKAPNPTGGDNLGSSVDVSADGRYLVAGAIGEDSSSSGVTSTVNQRVIESGAAYVFVRDPDEDAWALVSMIKAPDPTTFDDFGSSARLSADGSTLAIGAEAGFSDDDLADDDQPMGIYVY